MIDPLYKAYRERWQAVKEVELKEQQSASIELRWQQLDSIYRLALGLNLKVQDEGDELVYERWAKLKGA